MADFYSTVPAPGETPVEYWVRLNKAVDAAEESLKRLRRHIEDPCQEAAMMFVKYCPDPTLAAVFKFKAPDKWAASEIQEHVNRYQLEMKERQRDDIIIGTNVIRFLMHQLKITNDYWRLVSGGGCPPECEQFLDLMANSSRWRGEELPDKIGTVKLQQSVTLLARQEHLVWGKLPSNVSMSPGSTVIVEATSSKSMPRSIMVGRIITPLWGDRWVPMKVTNLLDKPVTLKRNSKLADVSPCVAVEDFEVFQGTCQPQKSEQEKEKDDAHLTDLKQRLKQVGLSEIDIDLCHVGQGGKEKLVKMLEKYNDIFSKHTHDCGKAEGFVQRIRLTDERPFRLPYRRVPPAHYQKLRQVLSEMEEQEIIRRSVSEYASPLVLVWKKDGSLRICTDFRWLNARTLKDAHPLPHQSDCLAALGGNTYFSTMDLTSGFYNIPMAEEDKKYTAFTTPMGLFEYNRMPQGLCNSPASFMRMMLSIFGDLNFSSLLCYLDDLLVFARTEEEALERLETVFQRLRIHNLKLSPKKCHLMRSSVKFLGHIIDGNGVPVDPAKVEVIAKMTKAELMEDDGCTPSVKRIKSFLGMIFYYQHFIPSCSSMAKPLFALTAGQKRRGRVKTGTNADHFTKLAHAFPCTNQTAKQVAKKLWDHVFCVYGFPERIHSDQGADFESELLAELLKFSGVSKSHTTAYHPMGNGGTERFNRTLGNMLRSLPLREKNKWPQQIQSLTFAYNATVHETMGFAPFQLMFGRIPRLLVDVMFKQVLCDPVVVDHKSYVKTLMSHLHEAARIAQTHAIKEQDKQAKGYNRKVKGTHLNIGDRVLIANKGERGKKKLADKWDATVYTVRDRNLQTHTYKLEDDSGNIKVVHRNLVLNISFLPVVTAELGDTGSEEGSCASDQLDSLDEETAEDRTSAWINLDDDESQETLSEGLSRLGESNQQAPEVVAGDSTQCSLVGEDCPDRDTDLDSLVAEPDLDSPSVLDTLPETALTHSHPSDTDRDAHTKPLPVAPVHVADAQMSPTDVCHDVGPQEQPRAGPDNVVMTRAGRFRENKSAQLAKVCTLEVRTLRVLRTVRTTSTLLVFLLPDIAVIRNRYIDHYGRLLLFVYHHYVRYSLSTLSVGAIFVIYSWMFLVSSWTVVLTLTSPRPPSFRLAYSLRVLDLGGFYLLLWPAYYSSRVPDHGQGVGVDGPDLVLTVQLTPQDLPYPLQVLGGCSFPSGLFMVPIHLRDPQALVECSQLLQSVGVNHVGPWCCPTLHTGDPFLDVCHCDGYWTLFREVAMLLLALPPPLPHTLLSLSWWIIRGAKPHR
ncbi:hypothetical protein ACER0C_003247 [Sarotherodon galilaeus]